MDPRYTIPGQAVDHRDEQSMDWPAVQMRAVLATAGDGLHTIL